MACRRFDLSPLLIMGMIVVIFGNIGNATSDCTITNTDGCIDGFFEGASLYYNMGLLNGSLQSQLITLNAMEKIAYDPDNNEDVRTFCETYYIGMVPLYNEYAAKYNVMVDILNNMSYNMGTYEQYNSIKLNYVPLKL